MKLRPLHDKVVVERQEEEKTSAGGIILSGSATEKPSQGKVIAVGPGKKNDSGELTHMGVSVGDTVIFGQYGGSQKCDSKFLSTCSFWVCLRSGAHVIKTKKRQQHCHCWFDYYTPRWRSTSCFAPPPFWQYFLSPSLLSFASEVMKLPSSPHPCLQSPYPKSC